jgi:hypothetical protein
MVAATLAVRAAVADAVAALVAPPPPTTPIAVPPTIFHVHCACVPLTRVHARAWPIAYTLIPQVFYN